MGETLAPGSGGDGWLAVVLRNSDRRPVVMQLGGDGVQQLADLGQVFLGVLALRQPAGVFVGELGLDQHRPRLRVARRPRRDERQPLVGLPQRGLGLLADRDHRGDELAVALHEVVRRQPLLERGEVVEVGEQGSPAVGRPAVHVAPTHNARVAGYTDVELFGPDVCVYVVNDLDRAVEVADDSPFGLTAAVFTVLNTALLRTRIRVENAALAALR